MISGLHKGDAVIFCYAHLLIMQISADQHSTQPKSNNMSSSWYWKWKSPRVLCWALSFCWTSHTRLLAVASFPSSANAWRSLIYGTSAVSGKINHGVVMPFNQGKKKFWFAAALMLLMEFGCIDNEACCSVKLIIRWSNERLNLAAVLTILKFSVQCDALACCMWKGISRLFNS